jgi:hypothetical protein
MLVIRANFDCGVINAQNLTVGSLLGKTVPYIFPSKIVNYHRIEGCFTTAVEPKVTVFGL